VSDGSGRNQNRSKVSPWPYITVGLILAGIAFGGYGVIWWRAAERKIAEKRKRAEEEKRRAEESPSPSPGTPKITITGTLFMALSSANPTSGVAPPLPVQFTGKASGGTLPYSFLWDFRDGSTSSEQNPAHQFNAAGTYDCVLTVTDFRSAVSATSVTITVWPRRGGGR